jgi:hypothetical protein
MLQRIMRNLQPGLASNNWTECSVTHGEGGGFPPLQEIRLRNHLREWAIVTAQSSGKESKSIVCFESISKWHRECEPTSSAHSSAVETLLSGQNTSAICISSSLLPQTSPQFPKFADPAKTRSNGDQPLATNPTERSNYE